jgi:hypothetical protein
MGRIWRRAGTAGLVLMGGCAFGQSVVSWVSDPVRPDETVLLRGAGFGTHPMVECARLDDGAPDAAAGQPLAWVTIGAIQPSDDSLKFIVPTTMAPGVFCCRVVADGSRSEPVMLNRPDVWWSQGDAGPDATPGGWVRIFGTCLGTDRATVRAELVDAAGAMTPMMVETADDWSLRLRIAADVKPGPYALRLHAGHGGAGAWCHSAHVTIVAPAPWPATVFNVLADSGPDAVRDMRKTLVKYGQPVERTKEVQAALAKAKAGGGGIVFFPAGRYHLATPLEVPPHTTLQGEGMGLVTLWWGEGTFNLDGGGDRGLATGKEAEPPASLISGPAFGIESLSIYLPLSHRTGIDAYGESNLRHVRVRVDHLWAQDGNKRPEGTAIRLGRHFELSDCDIIAKGVGVVVGEYGVVARNRILAGKSPCSMGSSRAAIIEDNQFVSTFPTAYENIAGVGQDIYFARNRHEAQSAHQADFSFTFDIGGSAYQGALAAVQGVTLTLAGDPHFPEWANDHSALWRKAVVCVVSGTGSGQWRSVSGYAGRVWTLTQPFIIPPNERSLVTIVPLCGRSLIIGNRFEDANWVNAGFGSALDVIYAGNTLVRCAQMLNYGLASPQALLPNFNVQGFDNVLSEGQCSIEANGSVRPADAFSGQITQNVIHRREHLTADNSGSVVLQGAVRDVIVEGLSAEHPLSVITVGQGPSGILLRHCRSSTGDVPCTGAVQVP